MLVVSQLQKSACAAMSAHLRKLAGRVPAGVKAAELMRNTAIANRLEKLADSLDRTQNIIHTVDEVYADKSAAYRHKLVTGLVGSLKSALFGFGGSGSPPMFPKGQPMRPDLHPEPLPDSPGGPGFGEMYGQKFKEMFTGGNDNVAPSRMPPAHAKYPWWFEGEGGSEGGNPQLGADALGGGASPQGWEAPPAGATGSIQPQTPGMPSPDAAPYEMGGGGGGPQQAGFGSGLMNFAKEHPYITAGVAGGGLLGMMYKHHEAKAREREQMMQELAMRQSMGGGGGGGGGGRGPSRVLEFM